jgi:hypothetical protein
MVGVWRALPDLPGGRKGENGPGREPFRDAPGESWFADMLSVKCRGFPFS